MTPSTPRKRGAAAKTETQAAVAQVAPEAAVAPADSFTAKAAEIRETARKQIAEARHDQLVALVDAGEERRRDRDSEEPCGLEIDSEFEPDRLLDRQVRHFRAVQDLCDIAR